MNIWLSIYEPTFSCSTIYDQKFFFLDSIACFHLEENETAKVAFTAGSNLEPSNPAYKSWIEKCDAAIASKIQECVELFISRC